MKTHVINNKHFIQTTLDTTRISEFNSSLNSLSSKLAALSDKEFNELKFTSEYEKNNFISDTINIIKYVSKTEAQKIFGYFGFELEINPNAQFKTENGIGYSLIGYPYVSAQTEKLSDLNIKKIHALVLKYTRNNPIKSVSENIDKEINNILEVLSELRPAIGRIQHGLHSYDIFKHSLKVMQKTVQDNNFKTLNDSDKKVLLLASLLHDITKKEGIADQTHPEDSANDAYFIVKKFELTKEEETKLNVIIKHHEWLKSVNTASSEEELNERLQECAYYFSSGNTFDMALIFTRADLKAVKSDNSFYDTTEGKGRIDFKGNIRSFGESADYYAVKIKEEIAKLKNKTKSHSN